MTERERILNDFKHGRIPKGRKHVTSTIIFLLVFIFALVNVELVFIIHFV